MEQWPPLRTLVTIRRCSILEFGRGAYNQAVAPGITRLLHATVYDSRITSKSVHPCASAEINFAYPFQVFDDAMQSDVHKMLYPFYPISLCWLNLNSQYVV